METKQTAVEWLAKELESYGDPQICKITWEDLDSLVNQAKAMEKEKKIEFANNYGFDICGYDYERAEQYYNETFKSE